MKKRDIIRLIKNMEIINNSELLSLYEYCMHSDTALNNLKHLIKNNSELRTLYDKGKKAQQEYNDFKLNCNHPIRIRKGTEDDWDPFNRSYYSYKCKCIFCGHEILEKKSITNWIDSYYYNDCVYINDHNLGVWNYILNILLNKKDDDEIDFVKEFKKLNLDSGICEINDKKRIENNILIINDCEQDEDVNSKFIKKELSILKNLLKIDNLRIKIFSDCICSERKYRKNMYELCSKKDQFLFNENFDAVGQDFCTLEEELEGIKEMHIPVKLVINFSSHNYYDNNGNEVLIDKFIKNMFPNCTIINLKKSDLTKLNSKMIQELTNYIQNVVNSEFDYNQEDIKKFVKKYEMEKNGQITKG